MAGLLESLRHGSHLLLQSSDLSLHALPILSVFEYVANSIFKDKSLVQEARLLKIIASSRLGRLRDASLLLGQFLNQEDLPQSLERKKCEWDFDVSCRNLIMFSWVVCDPAISPAFLSTGIIFDTSKELSTTPNIQFLTFLSQRWEEVGDNICSCFLIAQPLSLLDRLELPPSQRKSLAG